MIKLIIFIGILILFVVGIDALKMYALGETGQSNQIASGLYTVFFLYIIIVGIISSGAEHGLISDGIPFVTIMGKDTTLISIMHDHLGLFVSETAELISLMFLISVVERIIPVNNKNISIMIVSRLIIVLVGIIANSFIVSLVIANDIYQWGLTCLQCLISGTTIIVSPAMLIGKLLGVDPDNPIIKYVVKKLPETAIGKGMSAAVTRSAVLLVGTMVLESQSGPLYGILEVGLNLLIAFLPIIVSIITLIIFTKSTFK